MQEVIVYRSPGEAALWQLLVDPRMFPIICAAVVFVSVFYLSQDWGRQQHWGSGARRGWGDTPAAPVVKLIGSAAVGAVVFWWLWI